MSNPLVHVGHFFKTLAVHIAHGFLALVGKEQAEAFGKAAVDMLKTEAGEVVMAAVKAVNTLLIPGADKKAKAFEIIKAQFSASGHDVKDSAINLLIEVAVAVLKGTIREVAAA